MNPQEMGLTSFLGTHETRKGRVPQGAKRRVARALSEVEGRALSEFCLQASHQIIELGDHGAHGIGLREVNTGALE